MSWPAAWRPVPAIPEVVALSVPAHAGAPAHPGSSWWQVALRRDIRAPLFLLRAAPSPLTAQGMTPAEMQMIPAALDRGRPLDAYDQAAWRGTDAMLADGQACFGT